MTRRSQLPEGRRVVKGSAILEIQIECLPANFNEGGGLTKKKMPSNLDQKDQCKFKSGFGPQTSPNCYEDKSKQA